jgi:predicted DNA-binding transcriptional regulator AlpA
VKKHDDVLDRKIEPMLTLDDVASLLACSRRTAERLKSGGTLPRPDLHVGRMPRWRASTVARWIDDEATRQGKAVRP